jgi:hypothetical protein
MAGGVPDGDVAGVGRAGVGVDAAGAGVDAIGMIVDSMIIDSAGVALDMASKAAVSPVAGPVFMEVSTAGKRFTAVGDSTVEADFMEVAASMEAVAVDSMAVVVTGKAVK